MHCFSSCILLILIIVIITNARPPIPLKQTDHLSPETHPDLNHSWELEDEYNDDDEFESKESLCEQAMDMIVRHRNIANLDPSIILTHCPHYEQRLALVLKNHALYNMNKGEEIKKKRNSGDINDKRRAFIRRQELKRRLALQFLRKRMS